VAEPAEHKVELETIALEGQFPAPSNVDELADAIRRGTEPQRPTRGNILLDLVVFLLAMIFLGGAWTVLHHWRPSVGVSYSEKAQPLLGTLSSLDLGTVRPGVDLLSLGASAQEMELQPGATTDTLLLPVSPKLCPKIARALSSTSCTRSGVLSTQGKIWASWSTTPQPANLILPSPGPHDTSGALETSSLDVAFPPEEPSATPGTSTSGARNANFVFPNSVEWCVPQPTGTSVTLDIRTTAGRPFSVRDFVTNSCTSGEQPGASDLALAVEPIKQLGPALPALTDLLGTTSLDFDTTAWSVDANQLGGVLQLGDDGPASLSPPAEVTLVNKSHGLQVGFDLQVVGKMASGGISILGQASAAWNGPTAFEPDLVKSWWDGESDIAVPLFVALCGLFFNLLAHLLSDIQKRWFPFE
jgi:hypothetical protein